MKRQIRSTEIKATDLPMSLRVFWLIAPKKMRNAMLIAAIICYCFLSPRLRAKYVFDIDPHMLVANLLVIGPSGCGKSLIRWVVQMLAGPVIKRDKAERRRELEYKEMCNKKRGSNKGVTEDAPLTVVRYMQSITVPKLVERADKIDRRYGNPLSFMIYTDEIATLIKTGKAKMEEEAVGRSAYMIGETYCRDTLYNDGYNALVDINWCSILCGQEYALNKYITDSAISCGDASRNIIVNLGNLIGDSAPMMRSMTDEEKECVASTTNRLMHDTYTEDDKLQPLHYIPMEWIDKDVKRWCKIQQDEVARCGSNALDSYYKRACSSAFRLAAMVYYLWDEDETKQPCVRRVFYWLAQMIVDGQMAQWGNRYEELQTSPKNGGKKEALFDQMPKRFTRDQLYQMVEKLGVKSPGRHFVHLWLTEKKWINEVETDLYEKKY